MDREIVGQEENIVVSMEQWKGKKKRIRIYRYCICGLILCAALVLCGMGYSYLDHRLPKVLWVRAGESQTLDLGLPMTGEVVAVSDGGKSNIPRDAITIDLGEAITLDMEESSNYRMNVKLFGWIPFKQVDIQVIGDMELTPAGMPVGLYVETDGLLVIGVGEFVGMDGITYSPSKYILKSGDYILECNGKEVSDKNTFIKDIERCGGKEVVLKISRNGEIQEVAIKPMTNSAGKYKIGIWVRDNAQGVGTLTYIDASGRFGALGHGVTDVDTSTLMDVEAGTLYRTEIISIQRGEAGTPGEMTGMIVYNENYILGEIDYNGEEGIFGKCNGQALSMCTQKPLPVGLKQEIKKGQAYIYCTVKENEPRYYAVEITNIQLDHDNVNRGIELTVTDPELLTLTGGIVQGMSGSPIIQDGKLIGAVTHVLVNDPTRGYGIFIENMLEH